MKVFLDDERATPEGWVRVFWPDEAIALLQTGEVEEISLDHDLGDDTRGTGYDVVIWLENEVAMHGLKPPVIHVHSANPPARAQMEQGVLAIQRLANR
ncbi:cyclic-phosphate processing receiver domain-containing protein [Chitinivorax sp. B]|uniref:cyclic-phosphate processing receiver domain-containing protein n=1 Tax=Chitinivorax sp. B TaxID=2502235 RepID=UPI0010FA1A0F|nr:cyclic-phosphate processing receiver domain-containing protein [Chitinivorax sp. B]